MDNAIAIGVCRSSAILPFEKRLVLTEHALQCLVDDPIAGAIDELAVEFEGGNDRTLEGDGSLFAGVLGLLRDKRRHGKPH